jgi:PAS domain S-box-containing protein
MTLDDRYLMVNASLCRMLGYTESELLSQTCEQITHPTDRIREAPLLAALLRGERKFYEIEKRYIHRDGSYVWVSLTSSPVSGPSGELLFRVSVIQDITEQKRAERILQINLQRFYHILSSMNSGVLLVSNEGQVEFGNQAFCDYFALGHSPADLVKLDSEEVLREIRVAYQYPDQALARIREVLERGDPVIGENVLMQNGRTLHRDFVPLNVDGVSHGRLWVHSDITERKRAEEQLQKLNRILNARNSSNQALLHATDEPAYLHEVCRVVTEDCGYVMMWIGYAEHDENKTIRPVASAGFEEGYLEKLKVTWADNERGQGPSGTAIRTGKPAMCRNVRTDPAFLPWREEAIKRGYASSLVIPFTMANGAVGAFAIYAREPDAFSDKEVSLLSDLAADLAFGIDTLRLRAAHSQAEEQLHESEERYRNLFNSMDEGFCIIEMIFDSEGRPSDYRFLKVNAAFEAQTGLHDAEGKLMRELAPAHEAHWFEIFGRIALTGEPAHFLDEAKALNRYYDVHAYRVGEAEQRQVAIVFNDISGLKRAEEEREATIEFLRLVNQSQGTKDLIHKATTFFQERSGSEAVGIRLREGNDYPYIESRGFPKEFIRAENKLCVLGANGKPTRDNLCNPTLECMCGSVISGCIDRSEPFFTAHGSFWTNSTSELLASTPEAERQYRMRNRCNGEGYESVALFPLHDGEERFGLLQLNDPRKGRFSAELIVLWERLTAYLATALSKFRAEEALRNSERQYRAIGELINYGVWVCEPDGRNTYASESFLKLVGMTQRQCSDFGWGEVLHPDDAERTIAAWKECVRTGGNWEIEHRFRGVDGRWHPILARGVPVRDDQGQIVCWTGINLDISSLKQSEQALLRSEKLASVGRMAAAIAHEINNPLGAVTNLLYLAKDAKELPESSREYLEMADAELRRIAHIARQSLGFYRESSAPAPISANEVLESAVDLLKSKIAAKHAVIQKRWDTEVTITAVAGELRQVFSNLLANSLDAIDGGGTIQLRISAGVDHDNQRRCVRITIADNGKGIAAESRQRIFEPFFTTKGSIGTGLGLWVSKEIVDKHQGRIRLRSSINGVRRGTAFTIVLPAENATPMPSGPAK